MTAYDDLSDDARNLMAGFSELDIAEIAAEQGRTITRAESERDGAYRERAQLLAWLAALHPAVRAPAPDVDEPGWQILYLRPAAGGQMSWHIAPRDLELFEHVEQVPVDDERAQWDGHTTEAKYQRIAELTTFLAGVAEVTGTPPCTCTYDTRCPACRADDPAIVRAFANHGITWPEDDEADEPGDSDSDVFALISEIASRLTDATDEGEYQAAGLIGDLANGRKTIAEARAELATITFRHV